MIIRINLIELVGNWTTDAKAEFDFEDSDISTKIVQDFELKIISTDTVDIIKQRISAHLFSLLTNEQSNWKNGKRCRFCFNDTVAIEDNFMQCETCERVYKYTDSYSKIPLPSPEYLFLCNSISTITPVNIFDGLTYNKAIETDIFSDYNHVIPTEISKTSIIDVYFYPDIYTLLVQTGEPLLFKAYTEDFWPKLRFDTFINQTDFTTEGNYLNQLNKQIDASTSLIKEFEKIDPFVLNNLDTAFSRVVISQENNVELDLLKIFHLYDVSEDTPFLSLSMNNNKHKYKIYKPLPYELVETWSEKIKGLVIRSRISNGVYYSLNISLNGHVKCFIPVEYSPELRRGLITNIITSANKILKNIDIPGLDTEYYKWGTVNSQTKFSSFNVQNSFIAENYDMNQIATISKCLNVYMVVNSSDENNLSFLYTFDNQNNQSVRYDRWLKDKINRKFKYAMNMSIVEYTEALDDLRKDFGEEFDLSDLQLKIVFEQWLTNNNEILTDLRTKGTLPSFFQSIIDGVIVRILNTNGQYKIYIQGIKTWKQETDILLFIKKLLGLRRDINTNTFFKKHCSITRDMLPGKKNKNIPLRDELHNALPDIYWKGFARQCQSKEQPTIFSNKTEYEEFMKSQEDKRPLTELEKIFTINAPDLSNDELNAKLQENNLPVSGNHRVRVLRLQQFLINNTEYTAGEINKIINRLMLPPASDVKNLENIKQYLKIQEFLIKENADNIYPNPKTFVIKKGSQDYYLTCPTDKNGVSKYMGFLPLDDHPNASKVSGDAKRKFCVPCCRGTIDTLRTSFCSAVIPYDEYLEGQNIDHTNYIKNERKFPLEDMRYGYLPDLLHELLNGTNVKKYTRIDNIKEQVFLRTGINQSNFSFIIALKYALKLKESLSEILVQLRDKLTDKIFRSLNSGNIYWQFNQSIEQFRNVLTMGNLEPIDFQTLWEYCSMPGILTTDGFNILIFQTNILDDNSTEIHVVCPQDQELSTFFDENKRNILLYSGSGSFEPIISIGNRGMWEGIHAFENNDTFDALQKWYFDACNVLSIQYDLTAKAIIKKLTTDVIIKQVYNQYNKVEYLITKDKYIIPCVYSGMSLLVPAISIKQMKKFIHSYNDTITKLEEYPELYQNINKENVAIKPPRIIAGDNMMVPFSGTIPEDLQQISGIYDPYNINEQILKKTKNIKLTAIQKKLINTELYEQFRFNLAHHMSGDNSQESFKDRIIIVDTIDYNELYPMPNIRVVYTMKLTLKMFNNFNDRVQNELKTNKMRANQILTNNINPIINRNDFSAPNNYTIYL